jgi:hypothetical protein
MKRYALILGALVAMMAACNKGGSKLDGDWSMLVSGTDNGSQHMKFSEGKNWEFTSRYNDGSANYTVSAHGTYKLDSEGKSLTMDTTGGDCTMEGGTDDQKKQFAPRREAFLKSMESVKGKAETSKVVWLNDNSFESDFQGSKVTFHRK